MARQGREAADEGKWRVSMGANKDWERLVGFQWGRGWCVCVGQSTYVQGRKGMRSAMDEVRVGGWGQEVYGVHEGRKGGYEGRKGGYDGLGRGRVELLNDCGSPGGVKTGEVGGGRSVGVVSNLLG